MYGNEWLLVGRGQLIFSGLFLGIVLTRELKFELELKADYVKLSIKSNQSPRDGYFEHSEPLADYVQLSISNKIQVPN